MSEIVTPKSELKYGNNTDELKVECSTKVANTGIDRNSKITVLLEKASKLGGEHLENYSSYCAKMTSVMEALTKDIDLNDITPEENLITGEVRFRRHAHIGDSKWTYTVTSKQQNVARQTTNSGEPVTTYDNLVTEQITEGGVTVHSATYISTIVLGVAEFITGFATAICISKVSQAVKTARAAATRDSGIVYKTASKEFKAVMDREVGILVKQSTGRAVRVVARLGATANAAMVALLVTSIVLEFLTKTSIWQLTILNKSTKDIYWTNVLDHGDLKYSPIDPDTNQPFRKIAKTEIELGEGGWSDEVSYTRAELTFDNEGALYGVTGDLILRFQENAIDEQPKFTLAFNIPYSGANSVTLTGNDGLEPQTTDHLAYQLIDVENNLKFTYSLSYEQGKHSVATINEGKNGWNYTSALTVEDLKENTDV